MERISHYEIIRRLGQGGMGEVYEATDLDLGRRVALKFIAGDHAHDPEALRRFEREARVAAALHHPHIATLFAFDRTTDRPFLVMELLTGRTLREALASGPMPVADALGISRDVAEALAYAHKREVSHRDIKPENLMFDSEGRVKITDFGLARLAETSRLTRTGATLGTPAYMAPELLRGTADDVPESSSGAPADVFALGVTVYEMLAGVTPFRGQQAMAVLYAIANTEPRPLRELRPEAPPEVEAIVVRMLEKDPARRPQASEVAAALAAVAGASPSAGWSVAPVRAGVAVETATTSAVTLAAERVPARDGETNLPVPVAAGTSSRPRRFRWLVAGLVAVGTLAALLVWGFGAGLEKLSPARYRRAVALNNEGHDSLAAGNLPAARQRFEAALAISPRYAEAKLNLANELTRAGEVDRAAALYGEVLAENPKHDELLAAAHYGLGELDLQAGAWPSAITHLGEAARMDSARAEYPNNLAFALIQSGRTDEALTVLRAAQARFPAEPALLKNAALAWFAAGEFDSALVAADRSVRLRPSYAAGWLVKLKCEAARGDRAAARASLEALRRLAPGDAMLAEAQAAIAEAPAGTNTARR